MQFTDEQKARAIHAGVNMAQMIDRLDPADAKKALHTFLPLALAYVTTAPPSVLEVAMANMSLLELDLLSRLIDLYEEEPK